MTGRYSWPPSSPWWPQQQRTKNEEDAVARWAKQKGSEQMPQQLTKGATMRRTENVDVSRETDSPLVWLVLGVLLCALFAVGASVGAAVVHSYGWLFGANCAFFVASILLAFAIAAEAKD